MSIRVDALVPGLSFAERPQPVDQTTLSIEPHFKEARIFPFSGDSNKHLTRTRAFTLPFLALFLGLVFLLSVCRHSSWKLAGPRPGPLGRQLAGNEDDFDFPSSPELERLCEAARDWASEEPSPGGQRESPALVEAYLENLKQLPEEQRASPALVDAYFKTLERPPEEQPESPRQVQAFYLSFERARPLEEREPVTKRSMFEEPAEGSGDDQPGPSTKFIRTAVGPQPAPPPSAAPPAPPTTSSPKKHSSTSAAAQAFPAITKVLAVSDENPSTSTATPPPLKVQAPAGGGEVHPYIRRPVLRPGVIVRPWLPEVVTSRVQLGLYMDSLVTVHALLLRPELGQEEVQSLMNHTEILANYIYGRAWVPYRPSMRYEKLATRLALKFLFFDQMDTAWRVVGGSRPGWWQAVADAGLADCDVIAAIPHLSYSAVHHELARKLAAALKHYKNGESPTPEEIMDLKCMIFLHPRRPRHFKNREWEPWRQDDNEKSWETCGQNF